MTASSARLLSTAVLDALAFFAAFLGACSTGDPASPAGPSPPRPTSSTLDANGWSLCQASDQAWVRRAILALHGRKGWGQAEVNVYEDIVRGVDALAVHVPTASNGLARARTLSPGRAVVAEALMAQDEFRLRWSDFLMDALHVVRIEDKSQRDCYADPSAQAVDNGELAAWVRDHVATASTPPVPGFTMRQLLSSALALDDLSVVYRGHLFAMISRPIHGANLDPVALERSRRQDFGGVFDAVYLHRNLVCLRCHNSEYSTTSDPDPTKNRAWPTPGLFERALFGASNGMHAEAEAATKGSDSLRAHSMLRYDGVVNAGGGAPPYGWSTHACGSFSRPSADPLLQIDTYFGNLRGDHASVWDLEASLHVGVDKLAARGSAELSNGAITDPDEAFAYLVAENVVERVWTEIMGAPLTVPNDFPRNQVQRDVLRALTTDFVGSHFSLKTLLLGILAQPTFNLKPPSAGCGTGPYDLPNVFDPWTIGSTDPTARGNGVGDAVFALSPRALVRSLHGAMQWPYVAEYPSDPTFQVAVGFFVKDADPGFRGLDFQGRIRWESVYGACARQGSGDFVARIVALADGRTDASLGDGIAAVKDRLLGEPQIEEALERPLLEALVGDTLESRSRDGFDDKLRRACGAFVSTPQFMLGGTVAEDSRTVPTLTPPEHGRRASCDSIAPRVAAQGYAVACHPDPVSVSAK